jgi:hypothetical protein
MTGLHYHKKVKAADEFEETSTTSASSPRRWR